LGEVLSELVEFLQPKAAEHRITLKLALPEGLPPIRADRRGLEEVLSNLISNAVNYSPDGGEVRVAAALRGDYLEIQVSDDGIGIDPEELPKIFDKFYRVKHPKTRQVIGTGLGLAIVKGIIEAHQGSVEVESEVDVGTTFRVLWPSAHTGRGLEHAGE
jgi:signal transduction histidine kinase